MADKKDPTLCVTCKTELPPNTEIDYFTQDSLCPTRDDTRFCEEVRRLIVHMEALFTAIAFGKNNDFDEKLNVWLGELGINDSGGRYGTGRDASASTMRCTGEVSGEEANPIHIVEIAL